MSYPPGWFVSYEINEMHDDMRRIQAEIRSQLEEPPVLHPIGTCTCSPCVDERVGKVIKTVLESEAPAPITRAAGVQDERNERFKLYKDVTGRRPYDSYEGWREEYELHGTQFAYEQMLHHTSEATPSKILDPSKESKLDDVLRAREAAAAEQRIVQRALMIAAVTLYSALIALFILMPHFQPVLILCIIVMSTIIARKLPR